MKTDNTVQEYSKVINYIVEEIEAGRLIEGSKLPSERDLSEKTGINRNATREAISILRGMGLIDSKLGSGNYIINNTNKSLKQMVHILLMMGSISVKEIIDYRRFISRAIGTELIENGMTPETQKHIEDILDAMKDVTDEEFIELDVDFHLSLLNATGNRLFMKVMDPIGELYFDVVSNVILSSTSNDRANRVAMHDAIFRSIINKDAMACARAMKVHYDFVESKFEL